MIYYFNTYTTCPNKHVKDKEMKDKSTTINGAAFAKFITMLMKNEDATKGIKLVSRAKQRDEMRSKKAKMKQKRMRVGLRKMGLM